MHQRLLPCFPDLRAFLHHLEGRNEVARVAAPVDMALEVTEIHRHVIAGGGPVLHFARPQVNGIDASLPVIANLFGTRERVAAGLGTDGAGLPALGEMLAWMTSPRAPASMSEARAMLPAAQAVLRSRHRIVRDTMACMDADADLTQLPVQTCWPGDAGPLITWPVVITRPPGVDDPASYNLGIYRMQVLSRDRAIMRWLPMRGGAAHHREWARMDADMPVAVVIGADPATLLAAVMPAPEKVTELALAGIIAGRRPDLMACRSIPLHVPSSAEIVLEGTVSPTETAQEGPFGDHTGYYNAPEPFPIFRLTHMRVRQDASYLTTFTGRAPDEPSVIAEAMTELFKPLLRQRLPEIRDLWLPPEACSYRVAVLSIDKRYPGQARRVMMGLWSVLPQFVMTKMLIVVDADIDVHSWSDVMWAVATRSDPSRDLMTIERTPIDPLDFASPLAGLGGKLGIDATTKIGTETDRDWGVTLGMDATVTRRVAARWDELFPFSRVTRKAS
ncbi:MAG: 3-octaprenyl-4-hydroxybenzoate carboxy-lyase [Rhizobiales bacterium 17-65-6]|nr:MAG: 3-octaprenyl-4-hydroxybenzoate carboxy-lyase [Rhizobiales bacterium 32-66-11]OYY88672.1 MAG: 3-octaprenyl-4-hydroxybenzoate carboxy-lyase [Rhizobiales bacterium 35-66-30]OYZ73949.1 MAG: 3-octaprenyl-4-hydroxybenzoate carboxy-lyase [Rhizobiales bacterium 24-66-13]OYZ89599.1 MAG: 3-octaprenyl-4-hydroxybenzoate carboxy-lyase [Rhizobiales bacterium 17-65-6]OZB10755.1 MAG: 3-octaprenyl-4-hydroxybenzoate carboxy-lyase [Rhizobiales bacterium 39-66-18]